MLAALALATTGCTSQGPSPNARRDGTTNAATVAPSPAVPSEQAYDPAVALGLSDDQYADVARCALPELASPAAELVGVPEGRAAVVADGSTVRVVGRDGACEGQEPTDHRAPVDQGRVNVVMEDGLVIWAGRY